MLTSTQCLHVLLGKNEQNDKNGRLSHEVLDVNIAARSQKSISRMDSYEIPGPSGAGSFNPRHVDWT